MWKKQTSMVIHPPLTLHMQRDCSIMRGEEEATPPSKTIKKDTSVDEEDPHLGRREWIAFHRGIAEEQSGTRQVMASDMEDYLKEAERRWKKARRAWTAFRT